MLNQSSSKQALATVTMYVQLLHTTTHDRLRMSLNMCLQAHDSRKIGQERKLLDNYLHTVDINSTLLRGRLCEKYKHNNDVHWISCA
jgi:hypothetical protein